MSKAIWFLITAIVALAVLTAAGPTVVALANSLVTIVIVAGVVLGVLRLIWFWTSL